MLSLALWDSGCVKFIYGYVIPDLLEAKIESPIRIKKVRYDSGDRGRSSLDNNKETRR